MQTESGGFAQARIRLAAVYGLTIVGTIALFFVIRSFGETLAASPPVRGSVTAAAPAAATARPDVLMHVLLALLVIIVTCRATGLVFRYIGQPPVIGEVLAGILLGPSLLGRVAPAVSTYVLPPAVAPVLGLIAQLGVILYMFLVGLHLDTTALLRRGHTAVAISHASIVVPFLLGASLALTLYSRLSSGDVSFTVFALFLGVAMSVTAFPVLVRILTDWRMQKTPLGVMALTCAAVGDVTAWCLLALVVGVAQAKIGGAVVVVLEAVLFIGLMLFAVRPLLLRLCRFDQQEELTTGTISAVLVALLLSAWMTELIGIHAVFGAFLLGAIIPHAWVGARQFVRKMQDVVSVLLLPAFFAYTGMRTEVTLVSGVEDWLICGLIIAVATAGKFGGTFAGAKLTGTSYREAAALGVLMNTRGLMELVVLNIGLDLKAISPKLFAMMVLMALVTTIATTPILHLLTTRQESAALEGELAPECSLVTTA
jgi:Kef-type K+ transport system membrane component KefB